MGKYKVGYGKPPKDRRFKAGQSGNSRGRPKGSRSLATDLKEEFQQPMTIEEAGQLIPVTKQQALVKALIAKALTQDVRAIEKAFDLHARHVRQTPDAEDALEENEHEILRRCAPRLLKSLINTKPENTKPENTKPENTSKE